MRRSLHNTLTLLAAAVPVAAVLLTLQWHSRSRLAAELGRQPSGYLINLNAADRETLQLLPGVGPGLADAIVEYRTRVGGFTSIAQLQEVPRIGEVTLRRIRPWVTLNELTPPPDGER